MEKSKTFNYGKAIELLKQGKLVARENWNGKNMFVFMRPADKLSESFIVETVKSLPAAYKEWVKNHPSESGEVSFSSYLCLKTPNGTVVNGWIASQTDMLSEDWYEVTP